LQGGGVVVGDAHAEAIAGHVGKEDGHLNILGRGAVKGGVAGLEMVKEHIHGGDFVGGGVQELGQDDILHQVGAHIHGFEGFEEGLGGGGSVVFEEILSKHAGGALLPG
jgi:hypothetical protein